MYLRIPIVFFLGVMMMITACSTPQTTAKSNKKQQAKKTLITGDAITQNEMYTGIDGTLPRLRAMLCGRSVQYVIPRGSTIEDYKYVPWLVNDGQDSVVNYNLPVGEPAKDGYWIYQHTCLTSLPNAPTYVALIKYKKIDRDSIVAYCYNPPVGFKPNIDEILKDLPGYFKEILFKEIEKTEPFLIREYKRTAPMEFLGKDPFSQEPVPNTEIEYIRRYDKVTAGQIHKYKEGYNKDKELLTHTLGEFLFKKAMVRLDLLN